MLAFHWRDRKPVHYLCTGSVMSASMIRRNVKGTGPTMVPCPKPVNDYHAWMGGVDVHDQLPPQTFSIQTLFDLAMVNACISHEEACNLSNTPAIKHGEWYNVLHKQLLQLKNDFAGVSSTPSPGSQNRRRKRIGHSLTQSNDWVTVSGVQKCRQRSCKCYLCPKARRVYSGELKTCVQIWHENFECGLTIPTTLGKRVVLRHPGKKTGVQKKTRMELLREDECEANNELRRSSYGRSDADTEFGV
ncbi:hypothetical protein PHMEG_00034173 [Phytophthora megakarya]|uniref:PiggyBac transposable element-derived protein domain-containing protein n=1 Tax=Phytophthora megakarya TaxID=4795 RepID=A0A225UT35_9STRA|nr:hypothetical protein PHMEG_00034173 [Phytophthora megakarya]